MEESVWTGWKAACQTSYSWRTVHGITWHCHRQGPAPSTQTLLWNLRFVPPTFFSCTVTVLWECLHAALMMISACADVSACVSLLCSPGHSRPVEWIRSCKCRLHWRRINSCASRVPASLQEDQEGRVWRAKDVALNGGCIIPVCDGPNCREVDMLLPSWQSLLWGMLLETLHCGFWLSGKVPVPVAWRCWKGWKGMKEERWDRAGWVRSDWFMCQ